MTEELTLTLDDDLVKEATALFAEYGLTFEEGCLLFMRRSVECQGLPFAVTQEEMEEAMCLAAKAENDMASSGSTLDAQGQK